MSKMPTIKQTVKDFVRRTFWYDLIYTYKQKKLYREWLKAGKPIPQPHLVKQMIIKEYAREFNLSVFVETGTYLGDMVHAVEDVFDEIYSTELSKELYERAKRRFSSKDHIVILQGDSADVLPVVLSRVKEPCLFWLDAHYSGGITTKGTKNTPIMKELYHILRHSVNGHVILIDDARMFTGNDDYPTIQKLQDLAASIGPSCTFEVKDDIIRIVPIWHSADCKSDHKPQYKVS